VQPFINVWAAIGPLLGVLVGSWLTMRYQRKLWLLDNRRAEYRKLLSTLSESATQALHAFAIETVDPVLPRSSRRMTSAIAKSVNVIYSRLFIADDIKKLDVMKRWQSTLDALQKERNVITFHKKLDSLMDDLRAVALKDFS